MLFQMAMLMQVAAAPMSDSAGNRADWVSLPKGRAVGECVRSTLKPFDMSLVCKTAANDQLSDCQPAVDLPQPPPKAVRFAICIAKGYRIRATDASGKPVVGTTISVPIRFTTSP